MSDRLQIGAEAGVTLPGYNWNEVVLERKVLCDLAEEASKGGDALFVKSRFFESEVELQRELGRAEAALAIYTALGDLVERQAGKIPSLNMPDRVKSLLEKDFERIRARTKEQPPMDFTLTKPAMRRDFLIACFTLIPVGPEYMGLLPHLPRSLSYRGGVGQFFRFFKAVVEARGIGPFYTTHMTPGVPPTHFMLFYNQKTQEKMFRTIAECLQMNPAVRGFYAGSWWYDPALATVSPHLQFLCKGCTDRGAFLFKWGKHTSGMAFTNSTQRRESFERGDYHPIDHCVLWTRRAMLEWSQR